MRKFYIILLSVLLPLAAFAQNDFVLSEQLFSRIAINPAGTGNDQNVNIFSTTRLQYAGVENAPISTMLNLHGYIDKANSGLGLSVTYDYSGVAYQQIQAKAVYAYHINIKDHIISLGVGLGLYSKIFDPSKHILDDEAERGQGFPDRYQSLTNFDASFGIEYTNKYFLFGAAINHIPGYFYETTTLTSKPSYYAYMRGYIPCGQKFSLAPAIAYYYTGQYHVADVNVTGFIVNHVWVGLGYRTEATGYAMVGFEWNWLRIGYCCDVNFGKLNKIGSTSHELTLSFAIPTKATKISNTENK